MSTISWRSLPALLATVGAAAAIGATFHRLHFGISFEDESCYLAQPLRFVLGDRYFVDDLEIRQLSAVLLVPFVRLYVSATGGSDGIMLFGRVLYLVYGLGLAAVVFHVLRGRVPGIAALYTALMCAVYAPFNLFNLSYNSMGSGFLVAGCMLGIAGVESPRRRELHLALSGVAHGLAVTSYPTFAIVAAVYAGLLAWFLPAPRRRGLLAFALGAAAVGAPLAAFLLHAGIAPLRETLEFTRAWGTVYGSELLGGASKFRAMLAQVPLIGASVAIGTALSALLVAAGRRLPWLGVVCAPLLPLVAHQSALRDNNASLGFVIVFAAFAPAFAFSLRERRFVRTLVGLGWAPSMLAGLTAAWSSTNGIPNGAIGLLPACLVSSVVIVLWASERADASGAAPLRWAAQLTPVIGVAALVYAQFAGLASYAERPISELHHRVEVGPFRGIVTEETKHALLTYLAADLKQVVNPRGRILFYPDFPAGYLMTSMRPASPHTWVGGVFGRHARWYALHGSRDDVIVRFNNPRPGIQALDQTVLPGRRLAIDRGAYAIFTSSP